MHPSPVRKRLMTAIVGVHGAGNYVSGQPPDKVASRRSRASGPMPSPAAMLAAQSADLREATLSGGWPET